MYNWDEFDEKDQAILKLLSANARISFTDIGTELGISRTAVKKRVDALESSGVIEGYKVMLDPKESLPKTFMLIFECKEDSTEVVKEKLMVSEEIFNLLEVGSTTLVAVSNFENINVAKEFGTKLCRETGSVKKLKIGSILNVLKGHLVLN